jgi:hypothetical protein
MNKFWIKTEINKITLLLIFILSSASSQAFQPDTLNWDHILFPGFSKNDSSYSELINNKERICFRKVSTRRTPLWCMLLDFSKVLRQ